MLTAGLLYATRSSISIALSVTASSLCDVYINAYWLRYRSVTMVTTAKMSPSRFTSTPSLGFRRMVLLIGWSPTTLSVLMSTKRTGSLAVMTVVIFSLTVRSCMPSIVFWAFDCTAVNKATIITAQKCLNVLIMFYCFRSNYYIYFLFSLLFTRYTCVPYFTLTLFFRMFLDKALAAF